MAKPEKVHTETTAEMEARIRAEVRAEMGSKQEQVLQKPTRAQAAAELAAFLKTLGEKPRYRLTDKAYLGDVLYEPELEPWLPNSDPPERRALVVSFEGRPGPHMVPMNEAAKKMYAKYPPSGADPIADLSIVGEEGTAALKQVTNVG